MQHFFFPSVAQRVDADEGQIQFTGYCFRIARIKLFLYEDGPYIFFFTSVD